MRQVGEHITCELIRYNGRLSFDVLLDQRTQRLFRAVLVSQYAEPTTQRPVDPTEQPVVIVVHATVVLTFS